MRRHLDAEEYIASNALSLRIVHHGKGVSTMNKNHMVVVFKDEEIFRKEMYRNYMIQRELKYDL